MVAAAELYQTRLPTQGQFMLGTCALSKWAAPIRKKPTSDSFSVMFVAPDVKDTEMFMKLVFKKIILIFTLVKLHYSFCHFSCSRSLACFTNQRETVTNAKFVSLVTTFFS